MEKNVVSILIVDDSVESLDLILKSLPNHYKRQFALSAEKALEMILNNISVPDIILIDIKMHGIDELEVCEKFWRINKIKNIPIICIGSSDCFDDIEKAYAIGCIDFIMKSVNVEELKIKVEFHVKQSIIDRELIKQNKDLQELSYKKTSEIMKSQEATIYALAKLAEIRDSYTGNHLERVATVSGLIAEEYMNSCNEKMINNEYISILKQAAILHDIGKIGISDNILLKKGKLNKEEFENIKQHTIIGATAIRSVYDEYPDNSFLRMAVDIAHYHHEKWNGHGYPEGLKDLEIPLSARIVSLVDTYDALRTERPYKSVINHGDDIKIIISEKGEAFDPLLVDLLIDIESEIEELYYNNNISIHGINLA